MKRARKEFGGTFRRFSVLPGRYGVSSAKMRTRLRGMIEVLHRLETTPTIPVTAQTLERHPEFRSELETVDSAIHGYRHVAYASMAPSEQGRDLDAARRVFSNLGLPTTHGFRAPYLASNEATRELLSKAGFLYDSSLADFALPKSHPASLRAERLADTRYGSNALTPVRTKPPSSLIELPVSLPDDEILIDGLGIRAPSGLWQIYEAMMETAAAAGSHLILQVHPERFGICETAIEMLIEAAADRGAWLTSLSNAAEWALRVGQMAGKWPHGHSFAISITGDLDAVSIGDFMLRALGN